MPLPGNLPGLTGLLGLCLCLLSSPPAQAAEVDFSGYYERIFQIRVVSPDAGGKSSIGSGFQVTADGLIVTNYHVISAYVNSPEAYEIRYSTHDDKHGRLELLDFDVIHDLALLKHPDPGDTHFSFSNLPVVKGDMAYALGNPGDWGIVLVPGPNNGMVEHRYEQRVLFSGSLNPGMSGGPSLNQDGKVIGVNVATAGSQLSFLVPVKNAERLVSAGRQLNVSNYQAEITQQLKAWQRPRIRELIDQSWQAEDFAGKALFGEIRRDFQCWGDTNETVNDREVASVSRHCSAGDDVYIGDDLQVGQISFSFRQNKPVKLNSFQFARAQSSYMYPPNNSAYEHSTNFQCQTDFIGGTTAENKNYTRVVTCLRAYKQLAGLYDSLVMLQNHQHDEVFVARLSLAALERNQIQHLNKRFIERVR